MVVFMVKKWSETKVKNSPFTVAECADCISAIEQGQRYLQNHSPTPYLDAKWLLQGVLWWAKCGIREPSPYHIPTEDSLNNIIQDAIVSDTAFQGVNRTIPSGYASLYAYAITRRCSGEPVAHILGYKWFWDDAFYVNRHVLDPRPDTEIIIEQCLALLPPDFAGTFLDLGTGSGCLIITLLKKFSHARGVAVDICPHALKVAHININRLLCDDTRENLDLGTPSKESPYKTQRVQLVHTSWVTGLTGPFDVVVCNPPYIAPSDAHTMLTDVLDYDPKGALFAPDNGLAHYKTLFAQLPRVLSSNALVVFEIGRGQETALASLAQSMGWNPPDCVADYGGNPRCLVFSVEK